MSQRPLTFRLKLIYGLGDHSVNVALVALTMLLPFYLTEVVGMRVALAGLVPLAGRSADAITDVWMGRLSDRTTWVAGRRRPYLLIGALPFAASFAALWAAPQIVDPVWQFLYYAGVYVLFSISMTVVAVPYQALLPELTDDYHQRNSLATFRSVASIVGTLVTLVSFRPLAEAFGGGPEGWKRAGVVVALWIFWPWWPIYRVTWERRDLGGAAELGWRESLRLIGENRSFGRLVALFSLGRIAIDLPMALFLLYFTYWIGRPGDFEWVMGSFLVTVIFSMPLWLRFARGRDKATIYLFGCLGWVFGLGCLFVNQPDWPRALTIAFACLAAVGYSAADMIPWSMVADVADEDEILSGERREGLYVGIFTFIRKFAGAVGVAIAFLALDLAGFEQGAEPSEGVLWTLRALTAGVPLLFVIASAAAAWRYPLGWERHREILDELERRRATPAG